MLSIRICKTSERPSTFPESCKGKTTKQKPARTPRVNAEIFGATLLNPVLCSALSRINPVRRFRYAVPVRFMYQPKLPKDLRCPLEHALDFVSGRWKSRILCLLFSAGALRYGEIKKNLDSITDTVLAATLKEMIADGLVRREQFAEIPPRVEYDLDNKGRELVPFLRQSAAGQATTITRAKSPRPNSCTARTAWCAPRASSRSLKRLSAPSFFRPFIVRPDELDHGFNPSGSRSSDNSFTPFSRPVYARQKALRRLCENLARALCLR